MAYDEALAQRLRDGLAGVAGVSEKRMMGGVCLLVHGHMVAGVDRSREGEDRYMFRVGKDNEAEALRRPGAAVVDMGGRRIGGFVFVSADHCRDDALKAWVALAMSHVGKLPPKKPVRSKPAGGPERTSKRTSSRTLPGTSKHTPKRTAE